MEAASNLESPVNTENKVKKNRLSQFFHHIPSTWDLLKKTFKAWNERDPFRESAIIAYYAIFSLPALLVIVVAVAGFIFGKEAVTGQLSRQIRDMMGADTAKQIEEMIANASIGNKSIWATIIAVITLLAGATGVFVQLQKTLNMIWEVKPAPKKKAFLQFVRTRLLSFGMILSIGFLLIISLVITAIISALGQWLQQQLPDLTIVILQALNFLISFAIISLLFALIYKYIPDAKIQWNEVVWGAILTAALFSIGKLALGLYFAKANPTSTYGAAGSVILIMLWISYSCMIFFFGAEFTRQSKLMDGKKIIPAEGAMKDPEGKIKLKS
ncbi:MAG: YihY/virulence factor BrkB family protein [Chitinophagaceae bacterium]|nr:YihY/virulence factor BrkB family protein [Chitinophagaceae bacterium]